MPANTLRIYYLEAYFELLKTLRTPSFVLPSLLFPIMFYLFFGVLFNPSGNAQMPSYLLATYATFGVIGPALFAFGAEIAVEKDRHMLTMKQISPMPILAYFAAKAATCAAFALVISLSLFIVASVLGGVALPTSQWLFTLLVLLLGTLPFCALGLCMGLLLKAQSAPAVVNLVYLPMAFFSGLWIPLTMFPEIMQQIAFVFPPFHLAQLVLKIQGLDMGYHWAIHLFSLIAVTGLCLLIAQKAFRRGNEQ